MSQPLSLQAAKQLDQLRRDGVTVWVEQGGLRFRAPKGQLTDSHKNLLRQYKTEFLEILRSEAAVASAVEEERAVTAVVHAGPTSISADHSARFEPFPLTDVQSAYLLGRQHLFDYGGVACHVYLEVCYPQLDAARTEAAWNGLVLRHDMLRTTIDESGQQCVNESVPPLKVLYTEIGAYGDKDQSAKHLEAIRRDMDHRIYDTSQWPLFDLAVTDTGNGAILHLSMDFLIADWMSIWLLLAEFETIYKQGEGALPELELGFRDYVIAERTLRDSPAYASDRAYWLERVDGFPAAPELPLIKRQEEEAEARFRRCCLKLDAEEWTMLKRRVQKLGLTPTAAVLTAYAAVLERWSRSRSFCLNLTMLNRLSLHPQIPHIVGDFTAVNLLAVEWGEGKPFVEQAKTLQKQLFTDMDHRLFTGVEVMREMSRRQGGEAALMPIVFTSSIGLVEGKEDGRLEGVIGDYGISQTPQVFIDCQAMDSCHGLQVNWDVREGVFPDGMIDDMFDSFSKLLQGLAQGDCLLYAAEAVELPQWQLEERRQVNSVQQPLPDRQLHERVMAQARMAPDRIAVIDSRETVTYRELTERAAVVAQQLKAYGCAAGERVAIVMDKSVHQAVAVLGVMLAGAVYVPVDTSQPELRRWAMLKQADIRIVLTHSQKSLQWPEGVSAIAVERLEPHPDVTLPGEGSVHLDPDLPAYVIYTSGSTGEPKGVVVSHRAAANTITDINRRFAIGENDRVFALSQLGFDLSVFDLFGPLSIGGALVYPPEEGLTDPSQWTQCIVQHDVTVWNTAPALMQMLMSYLQAEPNLQLPNLRLALLSGDWIPLSLPDNMQLRLPSAQIAALGGATEAAIWSNCHVYQGTQPDWGSIPYGKPLANQSFRVLDERMRDCPVWTPGELYIGGYGLAEGYLGDREKTAECFIFHPEDGQRLYRTGDLGRYMPGGELEFLGRDDHQVKIRGHRIELGEIEAALLKHPAVGAAAVVVDGAGADKLLLAAVELAREPVMHLRTNQESFARLTEDIASLADIAATALDRTELEDAVQKLDQAVYSSMLEVLHELGLFSGGEPANLEAWLLYAGIAPAHHWLVRRWVARLTDAGHLTVHGERQYSCLYKPNPARLAEQWRQAEAAWTDKLSSASFVAYVRSSADRLPGLLLGQQDPVGLLFPEGRDDVVRSLYVDHLMAGYLNRGISSLLQRIAGEHPGRMLRVLEIGAGTGATTEHALAALEGIDVEYTFTDISSFFIPGAKTRFGSRLDMRFGLLDIDRDCREQGFAPNSFDVVVAAGVLENAKDIPASMRRVVELICPGGWFVFTEPTGEHAWILVSQAFMMMEPGDKLRDRSSYLERDEWLRLLNEYGDEGVLMLPKEGDVLEALGFHLYARRFKQDRAAVTAAKLNEFLAQQLPPVMLPSYLQIADALPLTANGKVDRRELAAWRPMPAAENIAADAQAPDADELEVQLSVLWAEALGVSAIGRTSNFYTYGADSLIMAQVAGKLREALAAVGRYAAIPFDSLLRHMLNHPTIEALAAFIRGRSQEVEPEQLLTNSQPESESETGFSGRADLGAAVESGRSSNAVLTSYGGGETGPLRVVFHAGLGTMNCFRFLLEHMKAQEAGPIIGITVADTEQFCAHEPAELIEQIAEDYATQLMDTGHREMQLVGYCLGGLIAVEVARRLVENGVRVADLVLIDSHPVQFAIDDELVIESLFVPNLNISLTGMDFGDVHPEELVRGLLHIYQHNNCTIPEGSSCRLGGDEGLDRAGQLFRTLSALSLRERFTAYVNAVARMNGERMPVEMAEGLFRLYRQSFKAAQFTPPPYVGDIRFLLAKEPFTFLPETQQMTLDFWQELCIGDFEVTEIDGNHFSCIEEESHAAQLAKLVVAPLVAY